MPTFSKRSLDALKGVHPNLVKLITEAIKDTPVDFTVVFGVRTAEEQNAIYKSNPKATTKDGYIKKSNHQVKADGYGHAVDIYPYYYGKVQSSTEGMTGRQAAELNEKQRLLANHIAAKAKSLGIKIIRGIDWKKPYDPPHFELG